MVPPQLTKQQKILIGLGVFLLSVLLVLILWYLFAHPLFTASLRNVSIIFVAITLIVMDIILILLMLQVIKLLSFLLVELKPILDSLQETSSTVRGTAGFVSEGVTSPIIDMSSKAAGVKGSIGFMVGSVLGVFSRGNGQAQPGGAPGATPGDSPPGAGRATPQANTTQETASHV